VVDPDAEQCASIKHRKYWSFLTTDSKIPLEKAIDRVRFVNKILGITPRRTPVDDVLARLGASVFSEIGHKGMLVNIGVGLPEEVCRLIYEGGLLKDITLLTESGVLGGLPAPGVFFGASVCPQKIMSSTEIFQMCYEKLDITILGALEVDSDGNVNVSKRGEGAINYVGPGGFIDLTAAAKNIIFVASWMARGEMKVESGKVVVTKPGKAKFIEKVSEITFSGKRALEQGKIVYYVTNVGVFRLTERGMELCRVMPGVDIQKDILDYAPMKIVLPEGGKDKVPVVDSGIITGQGFKLSLK
jgi:propionate CoA-transferase